MKIKKDASCTQSQRSIWEKQANEKFTFHTTILPSFRDLNPQRIANVWHRRCFWMECLQGYWIAPDMSAWPHLFWFIFWSSAASYQIEFLWFVALNELKWMHLVYLYKFCFGKIELIVIQTIELNHDIIFHDGDGIIIIYLQNKLKCWIEIASKSHFPENVSLAARIRSRTHSDSLSSKTTDVL